MIAHLRGAIAEKEPHQVVLDVGGVGYRLFIPLSTYEALPGVGETASILTVTHVREDAFHLYGFATRSERTLFGFLINVNSIGAKLALAALSTLSPANLCQAVAEADEVTLSRIPGIGRKTAQRLIIELRDKLPATGELAPALPTTPGVSSSAPATLRAELTSALINLGYRKAEAEQTLERVLTPEIATLGQGLRAALKALGR